MTRAQLLDTIIKDYKKRYRIGLREAYILADQFLGKRPERVECESVVLYSKN